MDVVTDLINFLIEIPPIFTQLENNYNSNSIDGVHNMHKLADRMVSSIFLYISILEVERALLVLSYEASEGGENIEEQDQNKRQAICDLLSCLLQIYQQARDHFYEKLNYLNTIGESTGYTSAQERSGVRGRPKFQVEKDHVKALRQLGFTWTKISSHLGISRSTMNRRRTELGVDGQPNYSDIPDDELDEFINNILTMSSNSGELMVRGALRARGIKEFREGV